MIKVEIKTYSLDRLLETIQEQDILIRDLLKVEEDTFSMKVSLRGLKKLKKKYQDYRIVNYEGLHFFLHHIAINYTLIFSLLISCVFLIYLSNLIFEVQIKGTSTLISERMKQTLLDYGIKKYQKKPNKNQIKKIENELYKVYEEDIDLLSIISQGSYIIVNYELRRKPIELETLKGKIFAKKDAIIDQILISSGQVKVIENQFVKKGDLLVDDYATNEDKMTYVGTKGIIYGITFSKVEFFSTTDLDSPQNILTYLMEGRYQISKDFMNEEEILEENVLVKDNEQHHLYIHYKCREILNSY